MAQNTVYKWPVQNTQAVCKTQDANAGEELILDGTMAEIGSAEISFIRAGFSRSVSIHSAEDLSGVNFTVTGMQNGGRVTQEFVGPNNATVWSDEVFDTITSVSVDGNVTNVQVGTGKTGFLPLISVDPNSSRVNIRNTNGLLSFSVRPFSTDENQASGITYQVIHSLDNVRDNKMSFLEQKRLKHFFDLFIDATDVEYFVGSILTNYLLVQITASINPTTDSLDFIYMQS